jgi:hypothetical protein
MTLPFTAPECFFALIIVFAIIGLIQGWMRAIFLLAFIGMGLLFFWGLNGGPGLAYFICVRAPAVIAATLGQSAPQICTPTAQIGQIMALIGFGLMGVIGYLVGNRWGKGKPTPASRLMGALFGIITGLMVAFFLNSFFSRGGNPLFTLSVETPNPVSYIPWVLVIGAMLGVVALVAKSLKK